MSKQNIYDNDLFYENFEKIRSKEINFNDIIETPIILGMIPELYKKKVLDIGCGMGQHALQYSKKGALSVLGIDISEKMLAYARKNNAAFNIEYRRLAFEELDDLEEKFDVITSSLAFDYVENFERLMKQIYSHLNENGKCVFSMSHPISTAYDGTFDRYTRTETGERLYANLRNYGIEGKRVIHWVVDEYELYHRTISTLINDIVSAGFIIEECQESKVPESIREKRADMFAQCLSALLIVLHLLRRKDACRLELRRLRVHPQEARRVLAIGIPTGLQNAIFAVANLFVQVGLNSFDAVTVSGSSAAANADTLLFNMMAAFYTGCASFVSRNWGAGKTERIVKSYLVSMCYAAGVGAVCGLLLLFFGRSFLGLFANETAVIDAGMQRLRIMSFSYVVSPLMDASIAASRGIGKSVGPTVIVILGSCVFRVIWVYTVFAWLGTITSLYLLYIFSWTITGAAEIVYFRRSYKKVILAAQSW